MISVLHAIKGSRAPEFRPKIVPKICKEIRKSWDASTKKPLIHYESAVYFLRVVEVTAVRPIPAETCKRLHAVPASYFFFAKLRSFGAKSVKIAYFLRIFNDFVIQI